MRFHFVTESSLLTLSGTVHHCTANKEITPCLLMRGVCLWEVLFRVLTGKIFMFWIGSHLWEVVACERWSPKEVWLYSQTPLNGHPLNTDTSLTTTVFFVPGKSPYISLNSTQLIQTPVNADDGPCWCGQFIIDQLWAVIDLSFWKNPH